MNRIIAALLATIILVQLGQLYVSYNFWQMDKRFVDDTYKELDKKTSSQYNEDNSHAL